MNKTFLTPITVLIGILGSMGLMAGNVFDPLIRFIHSGVITPAQAAGCLLFTAAGFAACYFLLNILCSYFVPRIPAGTGGSIEEMPFQTGGEKARTGK